MEIKNRSFCSAIKIFINNYKDILFFLLIFVAIGLSLVYGQILEANIGQYESFMVFGAPLPLWAIIIIPIFITLLYALSIYIAYKNNLLDFTNKSIAFISVLVIMTLYMTVLVLTKDNSHLFGLNNSNIVTNSFDDRLFSVFNFYLSILMIYAFYALFVRTKNFKLFIEIILIAIIGYALISVFYSLATEMDKYELIIKEGGIIDKDYQGVWIKSFYGIGNVFGHTVYVGMLSFIFLAMLTRKYWLGIFSIVFVPFIVFSGSRAGILGAFLFYIPFMLYLIYPAFKRKKRLGWTYLGTIVGLVVLFVLEMYVFKFISFEYNETTYQLKDLFGILINRMIDHRFNIIIDVYENATIVDYIYGLGYGIQFIPPRTFGYIYYMHNTFVEYLATGGIFYCAFILGFFINSFSKCLSIVKTRPCVLAVFISLIISQFGYGLFESIPVLSGNFFGAVFGLFFVVIINLEYQQEKGTMYKIDRLNVFKPKYNFEFSSEDTIKEEQALIIKNEIFEYMKKENIYDLNVNLVDENTFNEYSKLLITDYENYRRTYKSIYDIKQDKYYLNFKRL